MDYQILLSRNENTREVVVQEQARFIKAVIEALEVPIDLEPDEPFSIEQKIQFRKQLEAYHIKIIDDMDGGLKIYVNHDLIGEWYKATYKLKEDLSQLDKKDRLYLELNASFWTIFEEENEK